MGFSVAPSIGPSKFALLIQKFGSARLAWEAKTLDLSKIIGEKTAEKFNDFRQKFSIENYLEKLKRAKVAFVTLSDTEYPMLLKQITRPPFVLYVKGSLQRTDDRKQKTDSGKTENTEKSNPYYSGISGFRHQSSVVRAPIIAIVGTRKITQYGRDVTEMFTQDLVAAGFTIVSGLAMGVDATAHKKTIDNNGKTVAVLGCGVDCCTPLENQYLYEEILDQGGCIISELPLGHPPSPGSFPARNRIIAGLSLGILVTEGTEDSGSLITADYALKFNRKVFAVPGPITSQLSKGPYKLIEKGGKLVTSAQNIISELGIKNYELGSIKGQKSIKSIKGSTKEEEAILKILQNEALSFDEIARRTKLASSKLASTLSIMEIKGMVKDLENGDYALP